MQTAFIIITGVVTLMMYVHPSVCNMRYRGHICWNLGYTSNVSLRSSDPQHCQSSSREQPQISRGTGVGAFLKQNTFNISETVQARSRT